ncbi:MAG: glycosyltransferase [Armatimonadota bacterium]|nr:glycosyltransferase [Armatimonadota bacterium]MDR7422325.1 glycosyltransferase [Armatimonadota bacterium]MDR7453791.1 glycosyltransferase [Armatimonadota bacterium]MDR7455957.1 glycosyltransferase [Armatimonadota bacterium]MDR7496172.1 glycosyltransferase [Armatimonadota bacterium]
MTTGAPRVSVVVPCHDAAAVLPRTLAALDAQTLEPGVFEVVVVDDGSSDATAEIAERWPGAVRPHVIRQTNQGLAAARNRGAAAARGDVLLFLDADVLAQPDLVARHLDRHAASPAPLAVQGRTVPTPESLTTPFMRLSTARDRAAPGRPRDLSPLHVIGRNLSVAANAHRAIGGFDEGFVGYGFEDVEYACRLHSAGTRIVSEPSAAGLHHHPLSVEAAARRQRANGRAAVYFWRKHGCAAWLGVHLELHPALLPLKRLVYGTGVAPRLARRLRSWAERRGAQGLLDECYRILLWEAYYQGVFEALREAAPEPPRARRAAL